MASRADQSVTQLIAEWKGGDANALEVLLPVVYSELYRLAHSCLRGERTDHTLQSTALVNEAYLRLVSQGPNHIKDRAHFLGIAAHLMRQILVDHARAQRAAKRDGGKRVELDESVHPLQALDVDLLALDEALQELARLDSDQCKIVEMRFFAGLSVEEVATTMGISPATVKRQWATARAWLSRELGCT